MPSGKQLALINLERFEAWAAERHAAGDWSSYIRGGQLNRTEIARELVFASSVMRQNPAVKSALELLENQLREQGVLVPDERTASDKAGDKRGAISSARDKNRIKSLEQLTAIQKAKIQSLEDSLKRYELFEKHLSDTGRMIKS